MSPKQKEETKLKAVDAYMHQNQKQVTLQNQQQVTPQPESKPNRRVLWDEGIQVKEFYKSRLEELAVDNKEGRVVRSTGKLEWECSKEEPQWEELADSVHDVNCQNCTLAVTPTNLATRTGKHSKHCCRRDGGAWLMALTDAD